MDFFAIITFDGTLTAFSHMLFDFVKRNNDITSFELATNEQLLDKFLDHKRNSV
jgi:hypothetical protein